MKQLTYTLYNMCDSTRSGATHLPATIASLPTHLQRILITLLVVQVIVIKRLVNRLQRREQLRFQEAMMRPMSHVGGWCQIACASMAHAIVCFLCVFALRFVNVRVACYASAGASQAQNHAQICTFSLYSMDLRQQSSCHTHFRPM